MTVVPVHKGEDIGPGLLLEIIGDTGLSKREFLSLLKSRSKHQGSDK